MNKISSYFAPTGFQRLIAFTGVVLLLSLARVSTADQENFGDYELHYIAFNSQFLQPDVAKSYGIERSPRVGLVNISVLENGKPVKADVEIESANLLSQKTMLKPWLVDEGIAMYYLATFEHTNGELLHFTVRVTPENSQISKSVRFSKKFYEKL
ncbi:DUF4426 domain-containing protein [Sansalvadorimonas sp. 2012CJ34-2]|uniref:DUF4426 domain-containing protein n=1 Tax=Parendozoicomonas callyspongiae TaxID=2942213 RepID=A0ABT0PB12_9GAMM|nr:DUF4426 domain-containing protein [Sansalvadorimonas sp. 2012CJ34-2]MCL6268463.1 DUF4426 domain-containing protein [Sansalvadorimonas sp. 2012CJ34-2]